MPFTEGRWKSFVCTDMTCKHASSAKNWLCGCAVRWYGCPQHALWHQHAYTYEKYRQAQASKKPFQVSKRQAVDLTKGPPTLDGTKRRRVRRSTAPTLRSQNITHAMKVSCGVTRAKGQALSTYSSCPISRAKEDKGEKVMIPSSYVRKQSATSSTIESGSSQTTSGASSSCQTRLEASPALSESYRSLKRKKQEPYAPPSAELPRNLAAKFP